MNQLTIVVDGGASSSRLAAFDAVGQRLAEVVDGPASLSVGVEDACRHIQQGIQALRYRLVLPDDWQPARLALGLAGSLQQERRAQFLALLPGGDHCTLVTDGYAQLMGATGGKPGICLAVGTGAVLHWRDVNGATGMVGGWGFPVGDEGSGAWLGQRLLNDYLWFRDGYPGVVPTPDSMLGQLEARTGREVSDVQLWSTARRSTELASLAPIVIEAAAAGDQKAGKLLDQGAQHCLRLVALAPENLPVYLAGSIALALQGRLTQSLGERLLSAHGDALQGLYYLAN